MNHAPRQRPWLPLSRLRNWVPAGALLLFFGMPGIALADPPARVGRISEVTGTVSFHTSTQQDWDDAVLNYPVTTGNALWTEPRSQAAVDMGGSHVVLDGGTEFDVIQLDEGTLLGAVPQGAVFLDVQYLAPGERYEIQTPRGLVQIGAPGRYEVVSGDTEDPTSLTVVDGTARIAGDNGTLDVAPHQTAFLTGSAPYQGTVEAAGSDTFLEAMLARELPPAPPVSVPPPVQRMTGWRDLSAYGTWSSNPEYGPVWYPHVDPDWAPYREGRWEYVEPWGWTWVDAEPWGFAPFHYGRWAQIDDRWAWVPVMRSAPETVAPVYAPALVAFFNVGSVGVGVSVGGGGGDVGWVPLAPDEVYYPPYRASPTYVRNVNVTYVKNVTKIVNITNVNVRNEQNVRVTNYANRRAFMVMPAADMGSARSARLAARRADPSRVAEARPVVGHAPVAPPPPAERRPLPPSGGAAQAPARHAPPIDPRVFRERNVPLRPAEQVRATSDREGHAHARPAEQGATPAPTPPAPNGSAAPGRHGHPPRPVPTEQAPAEPGSARRVPGPRPYTTSPDEMPGQPPNGRAAHRPRQPEADGQSAPAGNVPPIARPETVTPTAPRVMRPTRPTEPYAARPAPVAPPAAYPGVRERQAGPHANPGADPLVPGARPERVLPNPARRPPEAEMRRRPPVPRPVPPGYAPPEAPPQPGAPHRRPYPPGEAPPPY